MTRGFVLEDFRGRRGRRGERIETTEPRAGGRNTYLPSIKLKRDTQKRRKPSPVPPRHTLAAHIHDLTSCCPGWFMAVEG